MCIGTYIDSPEDAGMVLYYYFEEKDYGDSEVDTVVAKHPLPSGGLHSGAAAVPENPVQSQEELELDLVLEERVV